MSEPAGLGPWSNRLRKRRHTGKTKFAMFVIPVVILAIIVLRIQVLLVGYYLDRVSWTKENTLPQLFYSVASFYDAVIISVNSLRVTTDRNDIPVKSPLPTIHLRVEPGSIDRMSSALPARKTATYYKARVLYPDATWRDIQYRFRGRNIWHWQPKKPSLRLKLKKRWPLERQRHINLNNPEDRPMIANLYGDRLAEKMGVLTNQSRFVRLFINKEYRGVYHWTTREDESLLIHKRRIHGPLYVGDTLSMRWQAKQFRLAGGAEAIDKKFKPMDKLVAALYAKRSPDQFRDLWRILSKEKYASWIAANHLTGSIHTDWNHNNLFYFDPTTGLLEQAISDMLGHGTQLFPLYKYRIWQDFVPVATVPMNERIYPLMNVALRDPTFYHRRNEVLYETIKGIGAAARQRHDLEAIFSRISGDAHADRYKTALQNSFVGYMPFPYSNAQFDESKRTLFDWIERREAFLLGELDKAKVTVRVQKEAEGGRILFMVEIDGHSAVHFDPKILGDRVYMDRSLSGVPTQRAVKQLLIYPGVRNYVGKDWNLHTYGEGRHLVPAAQRYLFAVAGTSLAKAVADLRKAFRHSLTKRPIDTDVQTVTRVERQGYAATEAGIHAWQFPAENRSQVTLGPGVVTLTKDLEIPATGTLEIKAGTTIRISKGRSIISRGRVTIDGNIDAPVRIERLDPKETWGGLVIQGPAAAGSRISHTRIQGGSLPGNSRAVYTGMVSIHNADDILIEQSNFAGNVLSDDTLHVVYGSLTIRESAFAKCFGDCIDLDYADGSISKITIESAGNDGIDFMGSKATITDVTINRAGDKGISVGEGTKLSVKRARIERTKTGIAVKDDSEVRLAGATLGWNDVAIDIYAKHHLYGNPGRIELSNTRFSTNEVNLRSETNGKVTLMGIPMPPKVVGDGTIVTKLR